MAIITFSKEIYPAGIIQQTAEAFGHLAEIHITEDSSSIAVSFNKCIYDEKRTTLEFGNYAIDLMNSPENG